MAAAQHSPAVEDYLETIYELEESGIPVMRARLVERLGVSAPTVSETVARLEREGFLALDDRRVVRLTERGRQSATGVMRRHRLAERLLVDVLHVPWHQVHEEAHRLEHAISETLEPYLVRVLGDPGTCPHGNPIPGSANAVDVAGQRPLADVPAGGRAVVRRIDEEVEAQPATMLALEEHLLMPGCPVEVVATAASGVDVHSDNGPWSLAAAVAAKIYVTV
ncbi:MAG: DtxR family transcriptional regulator, Mn-dependent transcriptional regulator [Frankiaceae bacterium]|jgi:DtxR family Mn-dependent transcriptional regulator|nr:DtxR family transcriptional regulator, Mn-dependent transcriptional regulator [Frankiaceae bacterium]